MAMPTHAGLLTGLATPAPATQNERGATGSWKYHSPSRSWRRIGTATLLSVLLHGGVAYFAKPHPEPKRKPAEAPMVTLTITMPEAKDLEDLDPLPADDVPETLDLSTLVPMQADLPQVAAPSDFVQRLDYASLIERPDLTAAKIMVIPDQIDRRALLARRVGTIFNLAELDRVPEPVVQSPPVYPYAMRQEAVPATVRVEFIVTSQGDVMSPVVVESTNPGFDEAAVAGVSKWKFRPGMRGGRRVNTRMAVPIVFRITDAE